MVCRVATVLEVILNKLPQSIVSLKVIHIFSLAMVSCIGVHLSVVIAFW
jgi:hypothetical protein